jgi:hypothetical protein
LVGDPEPEPVGWLEGELDGAEPIGVGTRVVPTADGLTNELGDRDIRADGAVGEPAGELVVRAGGVAGLPTAACGSA